MNRDASSMGHSVAPLMNGRLISVPFPPPPVTDDACAEHTGREPEGAVPVQCGRLLHVRFDAAVLGRLRNLLRVLQTIDR